MENMEHESISIARITKPDATGIAPRERLFTCFPLTVACFSGYTGQSSGLNVAIGLNLILFLM
jgi:hypothetical protein